MFKKNKSDFIAKPKRILLGAVDVGYRIELYVKLIKKNYNTRLFPESLSVYVSPSSHYKTEYTYEYHYHKRNSLNRWIQSLFNFTKCVFRYDVFHFISGETLLTRKLRPLEFWIYKKLNKEIIMQFVGSDIRSPDYLYWKNENIYDFLRGVNNYPKTLPWQDKLVSDTKKYADHILVSTPDLKQIIPDAEYYPVMLDVEKYLKELKNTESYQREADEIVILHAPSNGPLKGTPYIHQVLKELVTESKYKIKLLTPVHGKDLYSATRYDLFRMYKTADIVIDQMIIGWYGLQSIEALAAGKQTICYIDEKLKSFLFPECPIFLADVNNLKEVVTKCIENVIFKKTDFQKQLEWVKKYHTIENNNAALLKAWGI